MSKKNEALIWLLTIMGLLVFGPLCYAAMVASVAGI